MERLPAPEERQWLTEALRKLIAKRGGAQALDAAPLVEPANEWFPEKWAATAAHGHRLAQRLMHYAGLQRLRPTLSAYEPVMNDDGSAPWDAGTAGWFAGIEDGRAHFGLHVAQFSDPEAAAGVLAHEVAHAWRAHHGLVIDDRDEEEHLTDLTTVFLGFGILSTNNTDRYRTTGTWDVTAWSLSMAGYLPAQAMAWLLALWSAARGRPSERRAIEKHLEPNQLAYFRAALEELARAKQSPRALLGIMTPASALVAVRPSDVVLREPHADELDEPEYTEAEEVNRGETVYRRVKGSLGTHLFFGALGGFLFGGLVGMMVSGPSVATVVLGSVCALAGAAYFTNRSYREQCSECETVIDQSKAICSGCGGTIGRRVSERELSGIREEELERKAASLEYDECSLCEPERPCNEHKATERFGRPEDDPEIVQSPY